MVNMLAKYSAAKQLFLSFGREPEVVAFVSSSSRHLPTRSDVSRPSCTNNHVCEWPAGQKSYLLFLVATVEDSKRQGGGFKETASLRRSL